MLDAYVIEEIKRRERDRSRDARRAAVWPAPPPTPRPPERADPARPARPGRADDRGVVIIDYSSPS